MSSTFTMSSTRGSKSLTPGSKSSTSAKRTRDQLKSKSSTSGSTSSTSGSKSSTPAKRTKLDPGYLLMDVLNITYLGLDEIEPQKQLGTIKLVTGRGLQYLYRVEEVDVRKPSIKYGDSIPIIVRGPSATTFSDTGYLYFDLFCGAYKGIKRLSWQPELHEVSLKRKLLHSVDGTGRILVNIGRYAGAAVARVRINVKSNTTATTNVCGFVFAANSELEGPDCSSVLFMKKPGDEIIVGPHDEVVPLSKSFVGVPMHSKLRLEVSLMVNDHPHTDVLSFDPVDEGVDKVYLRKDKELKILVIVTWGVDVNEALIYDTDYCRQRDIMLHSADEMQFVVQEAVALEFHSLKDMIKRTWFADPIYSIMGISGSILKEVIYYCEQGVGAPSYKRFDIRYAKRDPVTLFNLIQAAHYLQIKSLMKLTCRILARNVVMEEFNLDDASIQNEMRIHSEEDIPDIGSILRQREKEALINRAYFVEFPISSWAKERQSVFKKAENPHLGRCLCNFMKAVYSKDRDLVKLFMASNSLYDLFDTDARLLHHLSYHYVEEIIQTLLLILKETGDSKDRKNINAEIQSIAAQILSYVLSRSRFLFYSRIAVSALVDLLSNPLALINVAGLVALTRLAFAHVSYKDAILANGALEKVQENLAKKFYKSRFIEGLAKFLAVVCSIHLPHNKVKVALSIAKHLLQMHSTHDRHIVLTCYALQYLSYERHENIEGEEWNKIIELLVKHIMNSFKIPDTTDACHAPIGCEDLVVCGSALGVVGNIVRWGHLHQIQTLVDDTYLLQCLESMLRCEYKKFTKEACQIISNIAARSRTLLLSNITAQRIPVLVRFLVPLCKLLENDVCESDVKMEAAWAIFNSIYGYECHKIDNYPKDIALLVTRHDPLEVQRT